MSETVLFRRMLLDLSMTSTRQQMFSSLLLLVASAIWGFAFVAQRAAMDHIGPFLFNGVRFALGTAVLLPFLLVSKRKRTRAGAKALRTRATIIGCGLAGVVLFGAASLQQIGVVHSTAGKAGFITGLYVVIVPILGRLVRQKISWTVWIAAAAATGGMYLLSVSDAMTVASGDLILLAGALGWAVHVHIVGWLANRVPPTVIAVVQFTICSILSLVVAVVQEPLVWADLRQAGWATAYAGILSVGVAYTLQIFGQRRVDPSRAVIILSLESVFAVLGGTLVLAEVLTARMLIGCGLMLVGMLLAQIRVTRKRDALRQAER